jgi:hypothetical protein
MIPEIKLDRTDKLILAAIAVLHGIHAACIMLLLYIK